MIDITLDMEQYDCPFIDTTTDHEVSFAAVHWEFDEATAELETRMLVEAPERGALEDGLGALADHPNMHDCRLLSKRGSVAHIRTAIEETNAMGVIREADGYITGPFHIAGGSEEWHVGFDRERVADDALSRLERHNEFEVVDRTDVELADLTGIVQHVGAARALLRGCQDLSVTERRTLETAVEGGYFESPRGASLSDLADEFGVSKTAVSKNLRRAQSKTLGRVVDAIRELD